MRRISWLDVAQYSSRSSGLLSAPRELWVPHASTVIGFPMCETCRELVDSIDLVDERDNGKSIVVLGKHHGAEDAVKIEFGRVPDDDDMRRALSNVVMFPVSHHEKAP